MAMSAYTVRRQPSAQRLVLECDTIVYRLATKMCGSTVDKSPVAVLLESFGKFGTMFLVDSVH